MSKDPIRWGGAQTNLYAHIGNDPVNLTDASGLAVSACQVYNRDWAHYWWIYYGFSHAYIQTDSAAFGLYPNGWGPASIENDRGSGGTCKEIDDVDEDCVNGYFLEGASWGPYGFSKNCATFVAEVLNACRKGAAPNPMPFNGQEGAPNNWDPSPAPFPPGGF